MLKNIVLIGFYFYCLLSTLVSPVSLAETVNNSDEKRFAFVIGNANYDSVSSLNNAENDAYDMAEKLASTNHNFDVYSVINGSKRVMDNAFDEFIQQIENTKSDVVVLLYYAGHGLQINGKNYLVPVDASFPESVQQAQQDLFSLRKYNLQIGLLDNVRFSVIILDACRDNPFKNQVNLNSQSGWSKVERVLPLQKRDDGLASGTYALFGTAPGAYAFDSTTDAGGKNGLFTSFLLKELDKPFITITDLYKSVAGSVSIASKGAQVPFQGGAFDGNFCFTLGECGKAESIPLWGYGLFLFVIILLAVTYQRFYKHKKQSSWAYEGVNLKDLIMQDANSVKQLMLHSQLSKGQLRGYLKDLNSEKLLHLIDDYETLTIGREEIDVDICIPKSQISRVHMQLGWEKEQQSFWINDLGSANGTWLGEDKPVAENARTYLQSGDVFYLADQETPLVYIAHKL